jgi:hypothetical protein
MGFLADYQLPVSYRTSVGNAIMGYGEARYTGATQAVLPVAGTFEEVEVYPSMDTKTPTIANNAFRTFCVPLLGLLGADKYIPLKYIAGGGIVLELTLAPAGVALITVGLW